MIIVSKELTPEDVKKLESAGHIVITAHPSDVSVMVDGSLSEPMVKAFKAIGEWAGPKLTAALNEALRQE